MSKILVVVETLSHYRYDVYRRLEEATGLDVEFVSGASSRDGSVAAIPFGMLKTVHLVHNHCFHGLVWQVGLIRVIRQARPDVVIFLGDAHFLSTWLAAGALRALGVGVIFWTIGWGKPDRGIRRLYRLWFYRIADRLLLYGDVGKRIGISMGYPSGRMAVIYNSCSDPWDDGRVDEAAVQRFRAGLPTGELPVVTAVVRLTAIKRLDMLIQAASILQKDGCQLSVLLVGAGSERERLEILAGSLGVALYCPGPAYSSRELDLVYELTTVTVVPSYAGLTVIQSLKHGIPVITHDFDYEQVPESEAIDPGVNGDRYEYGSVESLAWTIGHWIERQKLDSESISRSCLESIGTRWSPEAQSLAILREVREAIKHG